MSRTDRSQFIASRTAPRKRSKVELGLKLLREIKRRMKASGDLVTGVCKYQFHWQVGDTNAGGVVYANTKGEARAQIKLLLGIRDKRRLPSVIRIIRVENNADIDERVAACEIGPA